MMIAMVQEQSAAQPAASAVRCRRIEPGDIPALARLLNEGFPVRDSASWQISLQRLAAWTAEQSLPGFGFVLVDAEQPVGCLLTLYSADGTRCNFSSWHVAEGYRRFGTILVSAALRDRSLTYLNISSEKATRPIIEAQGFRRYSEGLVLACPMLALTSLARARVLAEDPTEADGARQDELVLMRHHRSFGCITFWCSAGGRVYPFVAVRRMIKDRLPVAQIVYCAADTPWRELAGAVGRALARHGLFLMLIDAAGPLPGLPGRFLPGRMPKYARGPAIPHAGDLAYTEAALIGT
jgi:hypothetical protein